MWQEATSPCKEVAAATKMEANIPFFFFLFFYIPKKIPLSRRPLR
jgi:hypothetical protein